MTDGPIDVCNHGNPKDKCPSCEIQAWLKQLQLEDRREQRRYEIARDVMAGFSSHPSMGDTNKYELAEKAVARADALLAELEKPR